MDILDNDGARLGIQGFLFDTTDPADDSLSVWLERLDTGDTISAGTTYGIQYQVTATPTIPEPATIVVWSVLCALGIGAGWRRGRPCGP